MKKENDDKIQVLQDELEAMKKRQVAMEKEYHAEVEAVKKELRELKEDMDNLKVVNTLSKAFAKLARKLLDLLKIEKLEPEPGLKWWEIVLQKYFPSNMDVAFEISKSDLKDVWENFSKRTRRIEVAHSTSNEVTLCD